MFSHVMVGVNDLEASKRVYDAVFAAMGVGPGITGKGRYYYRNATGTLGIITPINGQRATRSSGGTTCEDPPGLREGPSGKMYQAYGRDPDGNKFCAVYRLPK